MAHMSQQSFARMQAEREKNKERLHIAMLSLKLKGNLVVKPKACGFSDNSASHMNIEELEKAVRVFEDEAKIFERLSEDVYANSIEVTEKIRIARKALSKMAALSKNKPEKITTWLQFFTQLRASSLEIAAEQPKPQAQKTKKAFVPPTLEAVQNYIEFKGYKVDPKLFHEYYTKSEWVDSNGRPVKNWKNKAMIWDMNASEGRQPPRTDYQRMNARVDGPAQKGEDLLANYEFTPIEFKAKKEHWTCAHCGESADYGEKCSCGQAVV